MNASIIAIGSELLGTTRLDTNSLLITGLLERFGIGIVRKSVVADSLDAIAGEIRFCLESQDLILLTGGLGPTEDDLTRPALARALGLELDEDTDILEGIKARFARRGMVMPPVNARQAQVFRGQQTIPNARGTAPGAHLTVTEQGMEKHLWVFPGVPYELEGMLESAFEPWLKEKREGASRVRRVIRLTGMSESSVDEQLKPFYQNHPDDPITILASHGEVQIHLQADGNPDDSYPKLIAMEEELRAIYGERIFGVDDDLLESVVGRLLSSSGTTLSTAESCTGGLLASRITDVPGSTAYFIGGAVAYSAQPKLFMVGVDPENIEKHGEVSEEVARDMASGVRRRFNTTYGVGITGIAGPGGGSEEKPVGTVHVAVADQSTVTHRKLFFHGSRDLIKLWSTQTALDMLRIFLMRRSEPRSDQSVT